MSREKKYSPGPWRSNPTSAIVRDANGERVAKVLDIGICTADIEDANQYLITSAPELLEALEELLESCPCDPDETYKFLQANKRAERAIAKAYGEEAAEK